MTHQLLVNIDVDDLEKAVEFYSRGLGLTAGRRLGPDAVEMLGAGCAIYLLMKPTGTRPFIRAGAGRRYRRHWTPVHLDLAVPDLRAALDQALAAGAKLEGRVAERRWGSMARMADPFGHGFCLLQFKGRGYDEIVEAPPRPARARRQPVRARRRSG